MPNGVPRVGTTVLPGTHASIGASALTSSDVGCVARCSRGLVIGASVVCVVKVKVALSTNITVLSVSVPGPLMISSIRVWLHGWTSVSGGYLMSSNHVDLSSTTVTSRTALSVMSSVATVPLNCGTAVD